MLGNKPLYRLHTLHTYYRNNLFKQKKNGKSYRNIPTQNRKKNTTKKKKIILKLFDLSEIGKSPLRTLLCAHAASDTSDRERQERVVERSSSSREEQKKKTLKTV